MKRTFKQYLEGKIGYEEILLKARQCTFDSNVLNDRYENQKHMDYAINELRMDRRLIKLLQKELNRITHPGKAHKK